MTYWYYFKYFSGSSSFVIPRRSQEIAYCLEVSCISAKSKMLYLVYKMPKIIHLYKTKKRYSPEIFCTKLEKTVFPKQKNAGIHKSNHLTFPREFVPFYIWKERSDIFMPSHEEILPLDILFRVHIISFQKILVEGISRIFLKKGIQYWRQKLYTSP